MIAKINELLNASYAKSNGAYVVHGLSLTGRLNLADIFINALKLGEETSTVGQLNSYSDLIWFSTDGKMHTLWENYPENYELKDLFDTMDAYIRDKHNPERYCPVTRAVDLCEYPADKLDAINLKIELKTPFSKYIKGYIFLLTLIDKFDCAKSQDESMTETLPARIKRITNYIIDNCDAIDAKRPNISTGMVIEDLVNLSKALGGLECYYKSKSEPLSKFVLNDAINYILSTLHLYEYDSNVMNGTDISNFWLYDLISENVTPEVFFGK